jgi:hypothetical protein
VDFIGSENFYFGSIGFWLVSITYNSFSLMSCSQDDYFANIELSDVSVLGGLLFSLYEHMVNARLGCTNILELGYLPKLSNLSWLDPRYS